MPGTTDINGWTASGGDVRLQRSADAGVHGQVPIHTISTTWLAVSFLSVLGAWVLWIVFLPILWLYAGNIVVPFIPLVGGFLYSWFGFYYHELYHNYRNGLDNRFWFKVVACLMFSDPQVYPVIHPLHHSKVHTPDDHEFYCPEFRTNKRRRRLQFAIEFSFGVVAWELITRIRLLSQRRINWRESLKYVVLHWGHMLGLLAVCEWLRPYSGQAYLANYWISVWAGSLAIQHSKWIEHIGIFSDAPGLERRRLTRNLSRKTLASRIFSVFNHDEAAQHLFHHANPEFDSRGVPGLSLPPDAKFITIGEYPGVLWRFMRSL